MHIEVSYVKMLMHVISAHICHFTQSMTITRKSMRIIICLAAHDTLKLVKQNEKWFLDVFTCAMRLFVCAVSVEVRVDCSECERSFASKRSMHEHLETAHGGSFGFGLLPVFVGCVSGFSALVTQFVSVDTQCDLYRRHLLCINTWICPPQGVGGGGWRSY